MKKIKNIAFALILLFSVTACDLDRTPEDSVREEVSMTTLQEAQQVVFGIYSKFKSGALYSGYLTLAPDIQSDLVQGVEGYTNAYGELYRWNAKSTSKEFEAVYGSLYGVIAHCNFFLEKVKPLEEKFTKTEDVLILNKCKADVYFMRAMAYSELIRLFCEAYDPATADKQLGVSIVTAYKKAEKRPLRDNLKNSYQQVLNDLAEAELLIKRDGNSAPFVTIGAVQSLYARVYLHMNEWEKAMQYATKVIDNPNYDLANAIPRNPQDLGNTPYYQMWKMDEGIEVIWVISMSYSDMGGALGTMFLGPLVNMGQFQPDYIPAQTLLNLYSRNDMRQSIFFQTQQTSYPHRLTYPLLMKYSGNAYIDSEAGRLTLANRPKVFRLSEIYLIRAEAYYRLGMEKEACADLTKLRKARILQYGEALYSGEQLFKEIRDERARELCFEGFRLSDLKRWGMGFQRYAQPSTVDGPNKLKVEKDNPLFTWPIPKHEIDAVPGMQKNPSND